jgi:pimeloyl-ACP methyl ester carboxylesterase
MAIIARGDEMAETRMITTDDGRTVGFVDFGPTDGTPVLWCHGGPGSRLEPAQCLADPLSAGLRFIGIDRPAYGVSTAQPGRDIGGWVPDAIAVLDELGIDRVVAAGISTGGAFALALAATNPHRVSAVVACCAMTDMRWRQGRALMSDPTVAGVWDAPDRAAAMAIVESAFGVDGMKMFEPPPDVSPLPPADQALFTDPVWAAAMGDQATQMFAQGVQGYVDDRIADGAGWVTFDVDAINCPVVVLHGEADTIVPVAHAYYTAEIVPGATLDIVPDLGHLSVILQIPRVITELASRI